MADNGQGQVGGVPHVVIVGGGVAGLAAASLLRDEPVRVTVLEGASRLGGKLAVSEVAGVAVDEGAEATWRPKTAWLFTAAGLGDGLVSAGNAAAAIWTRGELRPLPGGQFMGVPSDMDELAKSGAVSAEGVARAREDLTLPAADRNGDVSVAAYVGARLGQEVVDRLVEPVLYEECGGRAAELSFDAALGPVAAASRRHRSLAAAAGSLIPQPGSGIPTLAEGLSTLTGGLGRLPGALAEGVLAASPGSAVRTGAMVTGLARGERGWRLTVGSGAGSERIAADAVILAVPAGPASRLLAGLPGAVAASAGLAEIGYTSVAMITLAYPRGAFAGRFAGLGFSSYRVPAVEGRAVKSVTFTTVKWPHLAGEVEIVRCQAGGFGEEELLQREDAELVALAAAELAETTGTAGRPVAARVSRWTQALPQYTVGHRDRVARIRAWVATQPGLAVCGAAYDGVGIGYCMITARKAADQVLAWLKDTAAPGRS
jgi:oxygen-dependent protoporphyrinogen oxidase